MLFTVGLETPKNANQAFGIVVPALCNEEYSCFSAADKEQEIVPQVTDAIHLTLEGMVEDEFDILKLKDKGVLFYKAQEEYNYCNLWLLVDIDLTAYTGKHKRLNISLP